MAEGCSDSGEVRLSLEDRLGLIVLSRPDFRNALSSHMWAAIPGGLDDLIGRGAAVIQIRGDGEAFAAGADLGELAAIETYRQARDIWATIYGALDAVANCPVPTVAAIDGPCMGGGCLLAASCDLRYATARSSFAVPVAKLGIVLDDMTISRLASTVGRAKARELLLRGHVIAAGEAERIGLVHSIWPAETFEDAVAVACREIAENSKATIQATRKALQRTSIYDAPVSHDAAVKSYLSEDFRRRIRNIQAASRKDEMDP